MPAAISPEFAPPRYAGNYTAEVVRGPHGDLVVYHFAFPERQGRRLLVLKLDHYGDFLIGLPALQKLRRAFPSDHITLVCGSWNLALATGLGIADEVRAYNFFPENGALWNGEPFESVERFREICSGRFDIAIDLRVDEDTRFLLEHVEAATRCGIGPRSRHPFLDIVLPPPFERRESEGRWMFIEPDRFQSQMPTRTPFFHENDFSVTNTHLIYGPYIALPNGQFRAHYGLRLLSGFPRLSRARINVDIAHSGGGEIAATGRVSWSRSGEALDASLDFTNADTRATYEFRVHARGRPLHSRLRFFGVRLERLGASDARFKRPELHIGEQLSLLIDLVEQRTRRPQTGQLFDPTAKPADGRPAAHIVISPLSNSGLRDWGAAHYAQLMALLLARTVCDIVLVGSLGQREALDRIAEQSGGGQRVVNMAGCDWGETAEIVRRAELVIANNSGVGHLAAALGAPTLAIYSGSHQPQEWGPRGNYVHAMMALVACSPCGYDKLEHCPNDHLCMKQILPETVADQAIEILFGTRRNRGNMLQVQW